MMTEYLLFDGTSVDGRGHASYTGRTTNPVKALNHYQRCMNPYSTGYVIILTDTKFSIASENDLDKEVLLRSNFEHSKED